MTLTKEEKTAVGKAIGATTPPVKERRTVRVDLTTFAVYPQRGRGARKRIGTVLHYKEDPTNRTPTGGKYTSRRLTVRLTGDPRDWVGQFRKDEPSIVILRPLP